MLDVLSCGDNRPCALPFTVTELDASTFEQLNDWSFSLEPFGLPSVAVPLVNEVLIGSFHSNRLAFFDLGAKATD